MRETKVITFSPMDYISGDSPVVSITHINEFSENTLSLWLDMRVSRNNVMLDSEDREIALAHFGSKAARMNATAIWMKAVTTVKFDIRGRVCRYNSVYPICDNAQKAIKLHTADAAVARAIIHNKETK